MAQNFNEINSLLTLDKTFDRANGQPLDNTVVWYDLAAAQAYAKTSKAYVGQQIMVIDPNTKSVTTYIITNEEGKLTKYYNQNEVDDELEKKQNILIDGVSIKTINNKSLLGEGNIEIKTTSEADQYFQINDNTLTIRPPSDELLMRVESAKGIALGTNGDINFSANGDIIVNSESIATKPYVSDQLKTKQNQLISGINIKTINGIDILGKGDIDIEVELSPINIHNSTGEFSLQQKQDPDAKYENGIAIQSKNPNAYLLDATLTNSESIGAKGDFATSFGGASSAQGKRSVAEGTNTIAKGAYSHAEGDNSVTLGSDSHAEGYATVTRGTASHAEGGETQALGGRSHAEGNGTVAEADNSHAEGFETHAQGIHSHAEGYQTYAQGTSAHAEGINTMAEYDGAHAEGAGTVASDHYSHAEGSGTIASGIASHAEGDHSTASGDFSHTGGDNSQAKGISSFAHGTGTIAEGDYSAAFGNSTIARGDNQFVIGKFNIPKDENTLFIIGNGGEGGYNKSNAFEVYKDGHAEVQTVNTEVNSVVNINYLLNNFIKTGTQEEFDALDATSSDAPIFFIVI